MNPVTPGRSSRFLRTPAASTAVCQYCGATLGHASLSCTRCGASTVGNADGQVERVRAHLQERIGDRFRLLDLIGYDGTETVFRAHDTTFRRDVALKVLALDLTLAPNAYARLEREVGLASQLDHPNITPVLDVGKRESVAFYTMGLAERGTVEEALNSSELMPFDRITAILHDVASALDYAHSQGVVHGAIKPSNILMGKDRACVAGFGTAEAIGGGDGASAGRVSSMAYMSPEQWHGTGPVNGRADQYALAVVAFEMITGQRRLSGGSVHGVPTLNPIAVTADLPLRPKLPLSVNAALRRALSKDPRHRFPTASEFVETLAGSRASAPEGLPTEHPDVEVVERQSPWLGLSLLIAAFIVVGAVALTLAGPKTGGWRLAATERINGVLSNVGLAIPMPELTPNEAPDATRTEAAARTGRTEPGTGVSSTPRRSASGTSTAASPSNAPTSGAGAGAGGTPPAGTGGYIRVQVNNGSGELVIDGEPRGSAPSTVEVSPGFHVVSIRGSARAYNPGRTVVVVGANDTSAVTFTAIGQSQQR